MALTVLGVLYATSATIQDDDKELVRQFAAKLFSKSDDTTRLIVGRKSNKPNFPAERSRCVDFVAFAESPIDQSLRAIDEPDLGRARIGERRARTRCAALVAYFQCIGCAFSKVLKIACTAFSVHTENSMH